MRWVWYYGKNPAMIAHDVARWSLSPTKAYELLEHQWAVRRILWSTPTDQIDKQARVLWSVFNIIDDTDAITDEARLLVKYWDQPWIRSALVDTRLTAQWMWAKMKQFFDVSNHTRYKAVLNEEMFQLLKDSDAALEALPSQSSARELWKQLLKGVQWVKKLRTVSALLKDKPELIQAAKWLISKHWLTPQQASNALMRVSRAWGSPKQLLDALNRWSKLISKPWSSIKSAAQLTKHLTTNWSKTIKALQPGAKDWAFETLLQQRSVWSTVSKNANSLMKDIASKFRTASSNPANSPAVSRQLQSLAANADEIAELASDPALLSQAAEWAESAWWAAQSARLSRLSWLLNSPAFHGFMKVLGVVWFITAGWDMYSTHTSLSSEYAQAESLWMDLMQEAIGDQYYQQMVVKWLLIIWAWIWLYITWTAAAWAAAMWAVPAAILAVATAWIYGVWEALNSASYADRVMAAEGEYFNWTDSLYLKHILVDLVHHPDINPETDKYSSFTTHAQHIANMFDRGSEYEELMHNASTTLPEMLLTTLVYEKTQSDLGSLYPALTNYASRSEITSALEEKKIELDALPSTASYSQRTKIEHELQTLENDKEAYTTWMDLLTSTAVRKIAYIKHQKWSSSRVEYLSSHWVEWDSPVQAIEKIVDWSAIATLWTPQEIDTLRNDPLRASIQQIAEHSPYDLSHVVAICANAVPPIEWTSKLLRTVSLYKSTYWSHSLPTISSNPNHYYGAWTERTTIEKFIQTWERDWYAFSDAEIDELDAKLLRTTTDNELKERYPQFAGTVGQNILYEISSRMYWYQWPNELELLKKFLRDDTKVHWSVDMSEVRWISIDQAYMGVWKLVWSTPDEYIYISEKWWDDASINITQELDSPQAWMKFIDQIERDWPAIDTDMDQSTNELSYEKIQQMKSIIYRHCNPLIKKEEFQWAVQASISHFEKEHCQDWWKPLPDTILVQALQCWLNNVWEYLYRKWRDPIKVEKTIVM